MLVSGMRLKCFQLGFSLYLQLTIKILMYQYLTVEKAHTVWEGFSE